MKILIGADLVPTASNEALFAAADVEKLVGSELLSVLQSADYRIFNLEVPLTDKLTPIEKCGPALIAPTASVEGIKALGVDLLTIGNNHILDQGVGGFETTISTLKEKGIGYVGAGVNLQEAAKPFILELEGKRIGIYACAEHEFSIAQQNAPGVNPFDPLETLDHLLQLKKSCDYMIVLYHGGKEYYRYPSPDLQKVCRKLIEKGADLVVCQHSHCVGCEEKYLQGTIVYGQGNFLFDRRINDCWDTGMLVCLDDLFKISYIPVVRQECGVRLAQEAEAETILSEFTARSERITKPGFIEEKFDELAEERLDDYLVALGGINRRSLTYRIACKLTGGKWHPYQMRKKFTKNKKLAIQNFVECEAHRELLLRGLKNGQINDEYKYE